MRVEWQVGGKSCGMFKKVKNEVTKGRKDLEDQVLSSRCLQARHGCDCQMF
jgi:hypothetical protein